MSVEQSNEGFTDNPDLVDKLDWMKQRLGLETNEELISKALSLLLQAIELEDRGYKVGAFTDPGIFEERDVIVYQIANQK